MKRTVITVFCLLTGALVFAQQAAVREGNLLYREGRFDDAVKKYDEAIAADPADLTASYNRANALAKKGDKAAARDEYNKLLEKAGTLQSNNSLRERALYDRGVLEQQEKQLAESIRSWKDALKLDPADTLARENLQKALREKKQQDAQQQQQQKQQPKDKKDQKQPPPPQSKLNQKQVEQLLKALEQKEKEVQKKMQQRTGAPNQPDKDW